MDNETEQEKINRIAEIFYPKGVKKVFRWFRHIYHYWKYTFHNLIYWLPIIWKDRQWDQCYFEEMMLHKLKAMRDFYQKGDNVWAANASETADEINEVIELLEHYEKDEYEEELDPHFNDWIKRDEPFFIDKTDENGNVYHTFNFPDLTEEEEEHRREIYRKAEENRQADLDKAYGLIAKNIRKWWD